jgi:hypothetical protein
MKRTNSQSHKTLLPALSKKPAALYLAAALMFAGSVHAQSGVNHTGSWYNQAESGWGLNITHQGDVLVPTWFTYDTDGKPLWLLVSGATKQPDGSYVGDIFRATGTAYNQINNSAALRTINKLGSARLTFNASGTLTFNYTLNGTSQSKTLQRVLLGASTPTCEFTTGSRATAGNFTDLWWNPVETGWGINMFHQDDLIYATWFTYDANGRDDWYTVSDARRQADGTFKGILYRARSGTPVLQINGQPALANGALENVGEMVFRFSNGERGTISYTIGNVTQTKNIERQVFASPQQVCRSGTPSSTGGGGGGGTGGTSSQCLGFPGAGETRRYASVIGNVPGYYQTGKGLTTFEGRSVTLVEQRDPQDRLVYKLYYDITSSTYEQVAIETFDTATGAKTSTGRYSNSIFPTNQAIGTSVTVNHTVRQENFNPSSFTEVRYTQTLERLPNETVTTAAGTFPDACKYQYSSTADSTQQGISVSARLVGPLWAKGSVGIKTDQTGTITSMGFTTEPDRVVIELQALQ